MLSSEIKYPIGFPNIRKYLNFIFKTKKCIIQKVKLNTSIGYLFNKLIFLRKEKSLKNILIICGSGASSGFIAQNMRKAAKAKGIKISVKAVSDTELEDYVSDYDLVLVGPHLRHRMVDIKKTVEPFNIEAKLIDQKSYATMDGVSILEEALN